MNKMMRQDTLAELQAWAKAAKAAGEDIARSKEELKRIIDMLVYDLIDDPNEKDEKGNPIIREVTVQDIFSHLLLLVMQDEKFRKGVPSGLIQKNITMIGITRRFEKRSLRFSFEFLKDCLKQEMAPILHKAYPAWSSLTGGAQGHMVTALVQKSKDIHRTPEEENLRAMFKQPTD
ncbi:hypothetical protein CEE45_01495 [Candidatus Heimdallarchaeota archaeon B3_Heim]|nr:MAG: hypothetical protein CEE45_01495 [Candidatus Heimdallarchaeota archaeon B3_Heim]